MFNIALHNSLQEEKHMGETEPSLFDKIINASREDFPLPIKTIDEVNVYCVMHSCLNCYGEMKHIRLEITSSWLGDMLFKTYSNTQGELIHMLRDIIPNLKYDKIHNVMMLNGSARKKDCDLECEIISHIPESSNIIFNYSECCVCLDKTTTKTSCNHYLCAKCESQIKTRTCPMCRKSYAQYEEEEE